MKQIIIVYYCRLPKQYCVFIRFQIHYLHLDNTDTSMRLFV